MYALRRRSHIPVKFDLLPDQRDVRNIFPRAVRWCDNHMRRRSVNNAFLEGVAEAVEKRGEKRDVDIRKRQQEDDKQRDLPVALYVLDCEERNCLQRHNYLPFGCNKPKTFPEGETLRTAAGFHSRRSRSFCIPLLVLLLPSLPYGKVVDGSKNNYQYNN